jgi:hypothetical protein
MVAPAPATSSRPEPAKPPAAQTGTLDPKSSFECGKHRCRVGSESCCSAGDVSVCAPDALPKPSDAIQPLGSQISLCQAAPHGIQVDEIARCRSSAQCPAGQLCCSQWLFSGGSALVCKPSAGRGATCDFGEVCTADLPCRTPNSVCVKGTCRRRAEIRCGGAPCNLQTHACLALGPSKSPECVADSDPRMATWCKEGRPLFRVTCLGQADCLPGERCNYALGSTTCQVADYGTSAVMCDRVGDCPDDLCKGGPPGKIKLVCARPAGSWHATCDCR